MTPKAPQINANQSQKDLSSRHTRVQLLCDARMTITTCAKEIKGGAFNFGHHSRPDEVISEITVKLTKFSPEACAGVGLCVLLVDTRLRLSSNCDPNGKENTDSPFTDLS